MHGKSDPVPLTGFSAREAIVASEIVGRLMSVRIGVGEVIAVRHQEHFPDPDAQWFAGFRRQGDIRF